MPSAKPAGMPVMLLQATEFAELAELAAVANDAVTALLALRANAACGVAVRSWRGLRTVKLFRSTLLFVRTSTSSQRAWPLKAVGPNSPALLSCTVKRPLLTGT